MANVARHEIENAGAVPMKWTGDYVGIPFADGGRDRNGCDCWGLVALVYREQLQIELPAYGDISAHDLVQVASKISAGADDAEVWLPVTEPRMYDVVVMRAWGERIAGHVGIYVDGSVLHSEAKTDTVMVPLSHFTVVRRIVGFRRNRIAT